MRVKQLLVLFFLLTYIAGSVAGQDNNSSSSEDERWRTTVLDFRVSSKLKEQEPDLGKDAREWLKSCLLASGQFELVDPEQARVILGKTVEMEDLFDKATRLKISVLAWQVVIQCRIMTSGGSLGISATLLEVQTGRIIHVLEVTGADQTIRELVRNLCTEINGVFPAHGKVHQVQEDAPPDKQVMLDKGSTFGIKKGMRFEIYTLTDVDGIKVKERLAEVEATEVQDSYTFAKIIRQAGNIPPPVRIIFKKGDRFQAMKSLGYLSITTVPEGASISISEARFPNTPARIELTPGEHVVSLSLPGYETWESKVTIKPYESTDLHVTLSPLEFSIESPPDNVKSREVYELTVKDRRKELVPAARFDWKISSFLGEKIEEDGKTKIRIADVKQPSREEFKGIWKEDGETQVSKIITINPRSKIGDFGAFVWRHKVAIGTTLGTAAIITYLIIKLSDRDSEGQVAVAFTFF